MVLVQSFPSKRQEKNQQRLNKEAQKLLKDFPRDGVNRHSGEYVTTVENHTCFVWVSKAKQVVGPVVRRASPSFR
jgi:hypothetical protein